MAWPQIFRPNIAKLQARGDVEGLVKCLQYRQWEVRRDAVQALGELQAGAAVKPLLAALRQDWSVEVQTRAAEALGRIKDPRAVPFLIDCLQSIIPTLKRKAADSLVHLGAASVEPLCVALQDLDPAVQEDAAWILGEIRDRRAMPHLISAMADESWEVRRAALEALQKIDPDWYDSEEAREMVPHLIAALVDEETGKNAASVLVRIGSAAVPALIRMLQQIHPWTSHLVAWALGEIKDPTALPALLIALAKGETVLQRVVVEALSRIDSHWRHHEKTLGLLPPLLKCLNNPDPKVRYPAARALVAIRNMGIVGPLIKILKEGTPPARQDAAEILGKLTGKDFGRDPVRWELWWKEEKPSLRSS